MGMNIRFADDTIYVGGRRTSFLQLADGDRVWWSAYRGHPLGGSISYVGGVLSATGFDVEQWGDQAVLVLPTEAATPREVCQRQIEVGGTAYTLTAVCEAHGTSVWLDAGVSQLYLLPAGSRVTLDFSASLLVGLAAVERAGRHYLVLVSLVDGAILFEGWVDEYSLQADLTVVCTFDDMRRHARTRTYGYKDSDFCMLAQSFGCANAHTYISTLVPYLFLEALAVGDCDEARGYLSPDLSADFDALLTYIGKVAVVRTPPVVAPLTTVGVVDATHRGKLFSFDLDGDTIIDVRLLDT